MKIFRFDSSSRSVCDKKIIPKSAVDDLFITSNVSGGGLLKVEQKIRHLKIVLKIVKKRSLLKPREIYF